MLTTVGMHYEVIPGRENDFITGFRKTVEVMRTLPGHLESKLYEDVDSKGSFVILSNWESKEAFQKFLQSPDFARATAWGKAEILRSRPRHKVYTHE